MCVCTWALLKVNASGERVNATPSLQSKYIIPGGRFRRCGERDVGGLGGRLGYGLGDCWVLGIAGHYMRGSLQLIPDEAAAAGCEPESN